MDAPRITHAHDGGTVHNHERYAMAEMRSAGASHSHNLRADWMPAWRDRLTARDNSATLRAAGGYDA